MTEPHAEAHAHAVAAHARIHERAEKAARLHSIPYALRHLFTTKEPRP